MPSSNAVDFSDFNEAAEDLAERPHGKTTPTAPYTLKVSCEFFEERYDQLFGLVFDKVLSVDVKTQEPLLQISYDQKDLFAESLASTDGSYITSSNGRLAGLEDDELLKDSNLPPLYPVLLEEWENRVLWDIQDFSPFDKGPQTNARPTKAPLVVIRNEVIDSDGWANGIVWDSENTLNAELSVAGFEDPYIINDMIERLKEDGVMLEPPMPPPIPQMATSKSSKDPFNLSNDHFYENMNRRDHVRLTHSSVTLQHSLPAVMLLIPFYKTQLSIRDRRSFHRPQIRFPVKEDIRFSKVKSFKKKVRFVGSESSDLSEEVKNLSLRDTTPYVLMEYSEEYPPIMSNYGMGSLILNYYRKVDEKDLTVPKAEIGCHTPLDKVDATPFLNFGDVEAGQVVQAISNNLVRAPVFPHEVPQTDFLLIKYTYKGSTRWYIREIPNIFVVGQLYPLMEVPRPQSRKVTNTMKNRLQVLCYRMMRSNAHQRMWYPKLIKHFVGQSEMQLKQRLKEFAQFWKKGENTGWWKLKPGKQLPSEEDIRKIVTPETVCLFESAMVGEQRLRDIGYSNLDFRDENEDDDTTADIEVQMAPWTTTKNFIMATQGKGMLKLFGDGDPTGRSEGFSFIRQSMKEMFYRQGDPAAEKAGWSTLLSADPNLFKEKEAKSKAYQRFSIAEQQVVYREEIKRIWNAQLRSLSNPDPPDTSNDDDSAMIEEDDLERIRYQKGQLEIFEENERKKEYGLSASSPSSPPVVPHLEGKRMVYSDVEDEVASVTGSLTSSYATQRRSKRLVINRLIRSAGGALEWRPEIISDLRVINAYLRQRKLIESQIANSEANQAPTDDDLKKQRKKKTQDQIIKLKQTSQSKKGKKKKEEEKPAPAVDKPFKLKIPLLASQKRKRSEQFESAMSSLELVISSIIKDHPSLSLELGPSPTAKKPYSLLEILENCKSLVYNVKEDLERDLSTLISNFAAELGHNNPVTMELKAVAAEIMQALVAADLALQ
ncbi:hypothetical protein HDU67_001023 [Dinochytrium kinnereticum]|nr:hypothetical protein HDU67_001023 [Dinochytrium kinnereticum]